VANRVECVADLARESGHGDNRAQTDQTRNQRVFDQVLARLVLYEGGKHMLDVLHIDISPEVLHIGPGSASVVQPLSVVASFDSSIGWNGKSMSSPGVPTHFFPLRTPFRNGKKPSRQSGRAPD